MIKTQFPHIRHTYRLITALLLSGSLAACQTMQTVEVEPSTTHLNASDEQSLIADDRVTALALLQTEPETTLPDGTESASNISTESKLANQADNYASDTRLGIKIEADSQIVSAESIEEEAARELQSITNEYLPIEMDSIALLEAQKIEAEELDAWHRLQQGMKMSPVNNDRVTVQLNWYLRHPGYLNRVMERARPFLPFILDEIEARNMPTEMALLPIVESAYQTYAYSHGRASGMWQIIPSTGRYLGLKQNWWYDGRRDIIESTKAALNYLESLAKQFDGDWELALASYNAGPGKIRSAVRYNRKRNKPTDFWHLTRIRNETRDYVPKLLALKQLFENPQNYEFELLPITDEIDYAIVELDAQIDLALAAELAGISINQLYQLNPAFNRWATAPKGPHRLLLPKENREQFELALQALPPEERIKWVRHKIKSGETLSQISHKYRTTTSLIKSVNKIRGTQIRAGKYLMVPTATRSLSSYTMTQSARVSKTQNVKRSGTKQYHVVRSGQSLWSISRRYGVTTSALAKWNAMAPIDTLRVGQKLVVWTKNASTTVKRVSFTDTGPDRGLHALRYTVRKGDSLSGIASRFNVRVSDIRRWNTLGKYLQPGQKIKLYVDITRQSG